jgi:hypothetical protein
VSCWLLFTLSVVSLAQSTPSTESSTATLSGLMRELRALDETLTASTSSTAIVSEEGLELLGSRSSSTATVAWAPSPQPPPAPDRANVSLVYTGASFGLGLERYTFELPRRLERALVGHGKIESLRTVHGLLAQGSSILVSPDRTAGALFDFFDEDGEARGITCEIPEEAWSVRTASERMLIRVGEEWIPGSRAPRWLKTITSSVAPREYELRVCHNYVGKEVLLYTPASPLFRPPKWRLFDFELRRGLALELSEDGHPRSLDIVGIPSNEAARRFRLLLSAIKDQDAIFADAGSFVDGPSRIDSGALSLHRPLAFEMLSRLGPAALVPGQSELLAGTKQLFGEAALAKIQYIAANWTSKDPRYALERSKLREIDLPFGGKLRIALIGALDPALKARVPRLKSEGISIDEPSQAVEKEIDRLVKSTAPPDLVIVLTSAGPATIESLRRVRGIDLIIGGAQRADERTKRLVIDLAPSSRSSATVLPLKGISLARLALALRNGRWRLASIEIAFEQTSEHLRPDARTTEVLTRVRSRAYRQLEKPLLEAKPGGALEALDEEEWHRVVCELVRRYTGADVALLPELPESDRTPGPATGVLLAERLAVLDQLATDELRGEDLASILKDPPSSIAFACGGEIRTGSPKVLGREIADERVYRIATTDRALSLGLEDRLESAHEDRLFEHQEATRLVERSGDPVTLRHAVLRMLREDAERSPDRLAELAPLLIDSAKKKKSAWLLSIDRVGLQLEGLRGANDAAFSMVPDAMVSSPSSLSVGYAGDGALIYDSRDLVADARVRSRYHRLSISNNPAQTLEDDLRFSSSLSLPGLELPSGPLAWDPYVEGAFDTEFSREHDAMTGALLPRREDLSATLGLSTEKGWIDRLRIGALAQKDLTRPYRRAPLGARTEAKINARLPRGVRLKTTIDASIFGNTNADDARDLRFKAFIEARLELPLMRYFALAPYARLYAFEGRVPASDHVAASWLLGLSFDLHAAFAL